jgi:hypothetical protein
MVMVGTELTLVMIPHSSHGPKSNLNVLMECAIYLMKVTQQHVIQLTQNA